MTPKEKAIDLVNKYIELGKDFTRGVSMNEYAKQCALIAVDEIINTGALGGILLYYYTEVKQELEKL